MMGWDIKKTEENYASLAPQLATTSGRVTSWPLSASSHHISCARDRVYEVLRLLRLRLRRGGGLLGVGDAAVGAAVGRRHALLHLHLHLVLLGLGHHLVGLLADGHVAPH